MLLQHAWLAPFVKPSVIMEEEEENENSPPLGSSSTASDEPVVLESGRADLDHLH